MATVCALFLCRADVVSVRSEPNLERRSSLALDQVEAELTAARKAYDDGQQEDFQLHVRTAGEMTDLSYDSLKQTGKRARKSPKWFKRAEQKLLGILRRIESLSKDVSVDDRPAVEALQKRVTGAHDQILQDIMSKK